MKDKIFVFIFIIYVSFFSITGIILKDKEISDVERRKLAKFPNVEANSEFVSKLDKYFLDHFAFRNEFRSIKSLYNYNILNKLDNNGIYLENDYIFKSNYPTNKKSIDSFIKNIEKTKDLVNNNNMYIMIIPDKNYYIENKDFLKLDYEYLYGEINKLNIKEINVKDILSLNDYYLTDTHWRQENLEKVVYRMSSVMNLNYTKQEYKENKYDNFYGVYFGQAALNKKGEQLTYLTNNVIENAHVKYLENKTLNKVYNEEKLYSLDSYEVYLDGASAYIEIINEQATAKKELIVFRDSFGSSLIPLLIKYYSNIKVVDNRYIGSKDYLNLIEFKDQDVLFIYSTLLVNDSSSLKG